MKKALNCYFYYSLFICISSGTALCIQFFNKGSLLPPDVIYVDNFQALTQVPIFLFDNS